MLEERVRTLSGDAAYRASATLQGVVKVAEQRLAKVRSELVEFERMLDADSRQLELAAGKAAPGRKGAS